MTKQKELLEAITQNSAKWSKVLNMSTNAFSNIRTGKSKLLSKHYKVIQQELERQLQLLEALRED